MKYILITGNHLTINNLKKINHNTKIKIDQRSLEKLEKNNSLLNQLATKGLKIYGYNYGVGSDVSNEVFNSIKFNRDQAYATASGFDYNLDSLESKKITIIRLNEMLSAGSTIRPKIVKIILKLLNKNIYPCYPKKGSISIGDICLMSHLSLFLMGDGYCWFNNQRKKCKTIFKKEKIKPIILQENEALVIMSSNAFTKNSLINSLINSKKLFKRILKNYNLSFKLINGNNLMHTKSGSQNLDVTLSQKINIAGKIQDPLSFRTFPIKLQLLEDNINRIEMLLNKKINVCDTNPSIFELQENLPVMKIDNKSILPTLGFDMMKITLLYEEMQIIINHIAKSQYYMIEKLLDPKYNKNKRYIATESNDFGVGYITRIIGQSMVEIIQDNFHSFHYVPSEEMVEDFSTNTLSLSECIQRKLDNLYYINKVHYFVNYLLNKKDNSLIKIFDKNQYFVIADVLDKIKI